MTETRVLWALVGIAYAMIGLLAWGLWGHLIDWTLASVVAIVVLLFVVIGLAVVLGIRDVREERRHRDDLDP